MRVGINARLLSAEPGYRQTGVARYIEQLAAALPGVMDAGDEVVLLGQPAPAGERPSRRAVWEQLALPRVAARHRLDVLHGPMSALPVAARCSKVVTIHDLAFLRMPELVPGPRRRYLTAMTRLSVRRAARVLAVSNHTKRDVVELLGVPEERVAVTTLAADARFGPVGDDTLTAFLDDQGLVRPFILAVGTLEPRKNLPSLLRAFGQIAPTIDYDLVLVGPDGWLNGDIDRTYLDLPDAIRERVRFAGFVADADLPSWYSAASLMVYPSLYEGFGLPALEAMACGTPVITSDRSSLPEVVGDAALTGDPADIDWLADAMRRLIDDSDLATALRTSGRKRAAEFSWETTARETARAYREAMEV